MRLIPGVFVLAGGLALERGTIPGEKDPSKRIGIGSPKLLSICDSRPDGRAGSGQPFQCPPQTEERAHMDHKPKHGGLFFMSLDNFHHLEGVILPPATLRIYLYDDHTKPLKAEETRKTSGTVQIGDSDDAPKISFAPGKKKETIEANLGDAVKFPIDLTVLLRLPGMSPDSKPELFNFTFAKFTDEHGPGSCRPMPSMPNMHC